MFMQKIQFKVKILSHRVTVVKADLFCRSVTILFKPCDFKTIVVATKYSNCMGTRIAQQHPRELEAIATLFMEAVWPMVVGVCRDQDFIINMDQSLILPCMPFAAMIKA